MLVEWASFYQNCLFHMQFIINYRLLFLLIQLRFCKYREGVFCVISHWIDEKLSGMILIRRSWFLMANVYNFIGRLGDETHFIYLFLWCGYSALSRRMHKGRSSPGLPSNRSSSFSGFIVQPFTIAAPFPSSCCLFVYMQSEKFFSLVMFVNVLVSLNITLCKYLVFSVSVWFHWKPIVWVFRCSKPGQTFHSPLMRFPNADV